MHPLSVDEMHRLVAAAEANGDLKALALILLMLDAGLRLGEARALKFGKVNFAGRTLLIDENLPTGGDGTPEVPKSGRARTVQLSQRLADVLRRLWDAQFRPGPDELVCRGVDSNNFRNREWRRICAQAEIGHRNMKDLRDTFASQLLTAGIQLAYVSKQLGHADIATTARHYGQWAESDGVYREPERLREGEVPADLLARLGEGLSVRPIRAAS